jgi:hypothetical protein
MTSWHTKEAEIVGTHKRMGREKKNISFNFCSFLARTKIGTWIKGVCTV